MTVTVMPFKVNYVKQETFDVKILKLVSEEGKKIVFIPGQWISLWLLKEDGKPKESRPYSISSAPTQNDHLELTIKVKGNFTQQVDKLIEGSRIGVAGPYGKFCYEDKMKDIVMIAGGVGIAPFMSYLRYINDKHLPTHATLLFTNRTPEDIIFHKELQELQRKNSNFKTVFTITRPETSHDWNGHTGRINDEMIMKHIPDLKNKIFFICGANQMCFDITKLLIQMGAPAENVKKELFGEFA